jgi:hypothetical protein
MALQRMTPEEAWSGRKPSVAHMRMFGCLAYAMVPDEKRGKLDTKDVAHLSMRSVRNTMGTRGTPE